MAKPVKEAKASHAAPMPFAGKRVVDVVETAGAGFGLGLR